LLRCSSLSQESFGSGEGEIRQERKATMTVCPR
jgi:hypothetical protein